MSSLNSRTSSLPFSLPIWPTSPSTLNPSYDIWPGTPSYWQAAGWSLEPLDQLPDFLLPPPEFDELENGTVTNTRGILGQDLAGASDSSKGKHTLPFVEGE